MSKPECSSCPISTGQQECFLYFPENREQSCGLKMGVTVKLLKNMCTSNCPDQYGKACNIQSLEQFSTHCLPIHGSYYKRSVLNILQNVYGVESVSDRELVVAGR